MAIKRDDTETKRVNGSVGDGRHEWDEEQALLVKVERRCTVQRNQRATTTART